MVASLKINLGTRPRYEGDHCFNTSHFLFIHFLMVDFSKAQFDQAMTQALPALWRFALSLSGSSDLADDLSQKTCLRALERTSQVYDVTGVRRWLMTICRSVWYNDLRANALRQTQSLDPAAGVDVAADILPTEMNIYAREVFMSVMALPEAHRSVVLLVLIEGHTYKETAAILDIPIGTVMSRLSSARAKLRPHLSDDPIVVRKKGLR